MSLTKLKKDKKIKLKTEKKLAQLINESDSGSESEHELSYYMNDRVKLMKEIIRILKPKKIKSMAPTCMKHLNNEEISSMLLEELLGISNKRLKKIFIGQPQDDESSSTEEEEEQPVDVISLDDISDDDFVIDLDSEEDKTNKKKRKKGKVKEEPKEKKTKVKKEKPEKHKSKYDDGIMDKGSEEHLMSVLELLELQARARAIRSQLALESRKKSQEKQQESEKDKTADNSDVDDAIIIESPKNEEIVITSSDSENEKTLSNRNENKKNSDDTDNNKNGRTNDDTNLSSRENEEKVKTKSKGVSISNVKTISNSPSEESRTSRSDYIPENPEEINKLLNKFHKRRKRKSANEETKNSKKQGIEKNRYEEGTAKSSKLKATSITEGNHNSKDSNKCCKDRTAEIDEEKPVAENSDDTQRSIFIDHGSVDGDDGIILTVDPAEMDSINLEPENNSNNLETQNSKKEPRNQIKVEDSTGYEKDNSKKIDNVRDKDKINAKQLSKEDKEGKGNIEDTESIILNVDQSELDCIYLD